MCMVDADCAWGTCSKGWCSGLMAGANCSAMGGMLGCGSGLFCWENTTNPAWSMCHKLVASGMAAPWTTWGYGHGCQSGTYVNTSGTPMCMSFDNMWGMVGLNMQCYHQDLMPYSDSLCMDGLYCDPVTSLCKQDTAPPSTCNIDMTDCFVSHRNSNDGDCYCNVSGQAPMCSRASCEPAGRTWFMWAQAHMKCGPAVAGMGRCLNSSNLGQNWNGSCTFRAQMCNPPKSYQECEGNFEMMMYKKVLLPSGSLCGMTWNPAGQIYWPSYCSSASLTQPLLVLVALLMALLQM